MKTRKNGILIFTVDAAAGFVRAELPGILTETVKISDMTQEQQMAILLHGVKQKMQDSYAGAKDAVAEGRFASRKAFIAERLPIVCEGIRTGETRKADPFAGVIAALAEFKKVSVAVAAEKFASMDDDQKKAVAGHAGILLIIARKKREAMEKREMELADMEGDDEMLDELFSDEA